MNKASHVSFVSITLLFIFLYAIGAYIFFIVRFDGNFIENDATVLSEAIYYADADESFLNAEKLYDNGATYVFFNVFLTRLTGLSIDTLQLYLLPIITSLIVLLAFMTFRALLDDNITALIATGLLYLQPDFLFVTWRGSHEKITWTIVLALFYLLAKSLSKTERQATLIKVMLLFYLLAFTLVTTNTFFSSSFIVALVFSFLIGTVFFTLNYWLRTAVDEVTRQHVYRLSYIAISCLILLYINMFYLYPRSASILRGVDSVGQQFQLLLFERQADDISSIDTNSQIAANPYQYVVDTWTSIYIYLSVTVYSWLLLIVAGLVWLYGVYQMWQSRTLKNVSWPRQLLWLLFPAFVLQLLLSVVSDQASGGIGGNVQVRLFIPVILTSVPIVAIAVHQALSVLYLMPRRLQFAVLSAIIMVIPLISLASFIKATNEPVFSNNWVFTTNSENYAGEWAYTNLDEGNVIWTGIDNRLVNRLRLYQVYSGEERIVFDGYSMALRTRYVLISDIERLRWVRGRYAIPNFSTENIIYDNGETQIYHFVPDNAYQQ